MQSIFVEITDNIAAAADALTACTHNHALVHNPFSWTEDAETKKSEESAE